MDRDEQSAKRHDEIAPRLALYELGRVDDAERAAIEAHALECDECFAELERGAVVSETLRQNARRFARVLASTPREAPAARRWLDWALRPAFAGPALVALVVGLVFITRGGNAPRDYRSLAVFPREQVSSSVTRGPHIDEATKEMMTTGVGYYDTNRFEEARRYFRAALGRDASLAEAAYFAGLCSAEIGEIDAAIEEFVRARSLATGELRAKAGWCVANAYLRAGRLADARAALDTLAAAPGTEAAGYDAKARDLLKHLPTS